MTAEYFSAISKKLHFVILFAFEIIPYLKPRKQPD